MTTSSESPEGRAESSGKTKRSARPWSTDIPDRHWDAIVIGSGMGGMTSAGMLAQLGRKVLLLEQHYVPGGFTHAFKRPGYEWDVGVHAIGEVTRHSMTGRLLHKLTAGALEWRSLGSEYDIFHYPDGLRVGFADTPDGFVANLAEAFPRHVDSIRAYLKRVREVSAAMRAYYLSRCLPSAIAWPFEQTLARRAKAELAATCAGVMESLVPDERLRAVLCAQWGYQGATPKHASFAMQALVTRHFAWGAYYPVGGSKRIAWTMLEELARNGGHTAIKADVERIEVVSGRACGVRLKDGRVLHAPMIVSACGARATVTRLLPEEHANASWARSIAALAAGPAHLCLNLGFRGDTRTVGASAANQWFYESYDTEKAFWAARPGAVRPDAPVLYCSFPSLKDGPLAEHTSSPAADSQTDPGILGEALPRHTGEVVTFVPWSAFARWQGTRWQRRGEEYEAFKSELQGALLEQFLKHRPGFSSMLDHVELSTPLSTDTFTRPVQGSIYGLLPTPERFANPYLRPRTPIPGLFLSGSEVGTAGVIGALLGGALAAISAEPMRAVPYVRSLVGS